MKKELSITFISIIILSFISGIIPLLGFICSVISIWLFVKLNTELNNYKISYERCSIELSNIKNNLNNEYKSIEDLKNKAKIEAEIIIDNAKNQLIDIENKIVQKNTYIEDIEEYSTKYNELVNKIDKNVVKLSKINTLYKKISYIVKKYDDADIFNENIHEAKLTTFEVEELNSLLPTVMLKLHSMDIRDLKKAFNQNSKSINEVLDRYEKRYTTKTNIAIYRLMVIALRAELQNVLYNLRFDKLDKSIEDIKKTTEKYLLIAGDGNKSIAGTLAKFINEIEYFFIRSIEIEYEYYVKKEQQKAEQAALREQMRQEAEERKILLEQQKQVEKEEEKYKLEIQKVQEQMLSLSDNDDKLQQLQAKIAELKNQLESVEHKKEEIISRQNGKAGYVYIISNLGSFGDNVFKVGMTRRLDPMDRVKELGDASVPFTFDVHSFIFSDDAVSLEQKLHGILTDNRVNKINNRKEFFRVDLEKLESIVQDVDPSAEFNITMIAEEYRQTLSLESENSDIEIA